MKQAVKGALAAGAAGSLLLGGAGSLAYWNNTQTINGSGITSGHLKLVQGTCDTGWKLNGTVTDLSAVVLSPGDTLTRHCAYTVSMSGTNLAAKLTVSTPGFETTGASALKDDMNVDGTFTYDADGAGAGVAAPLSGGVVSSITDGALVDATVTATFKNLGTEDNSANTGTDLTAALSAITVKVIQTSRDAEPTPTETPTP